MLLAVGAAWKLGLDRIAGQAALLTATLLAGALLALVGQTYQTGADPYELFTVWALAVTPWAVVGRFASLWLVWIGLLNTAVWLYFKTFDGVFGMIFTSEDAWWTLFALNTLALCAWQLAHWRGVSWLQQRWPLRLLATASGVMLTMLAVWALFDSKNMAALPVYLIWCGVGYYVYRHRMLDVFMLAGGVLSGIVVITSFLSKHFLKFDSAPAFLLIGMLVIGLSAAGGFWLKKVAAEERT